MPRTTKKKDVVVEKPSAPSLAVMTSKMTAAQKKQLMLVVLVAVVIGIIYLVKTQLLVATVNGQPITRLAVINELERQSGKKALDSIITKTIIEQEAAKKNITVSAAEVDAEVKKIEKSLSGQGTKLADALAQQGMTVQALRTQIVLQKKLEKLVGTVEKVSEKEVETFIKNNESAMGPEGVTKEMRTQIEEKLKQDKLGQKIEKWIADHEKAAKIIFLRNY